MRIIDNVNDLLGDGCKVEITPGSEIRIAASTFSMFAVEALRSALSQIRELKLIFASPSFVTSEVADKLRKERWEFLISSAGRGESNLAGSELEIRLRNELTQRAIARERAEWVSRDGAAEDDAHEGSNFGGNCAHETHEGIHRGAELKCCSVDAWRDVCVGIEAEI